MDFAWRWLCVGLAGLLVLTGSARGDDSGPRPLDIYLIDVMGGAATLIVTPETESILIDSGWPGFGGRDPRRIVHVLKDLAGCDHKDHLVITHWHRDHFGGVAGLAKAIEIKHYWDRGLPEDNDPSLDFPDGPKAGDPLAIAYREVSKGKRTALKPGDSSAFRGSLTSLVVASGGKVMQVAAPAAGPGQTERQPIFPFPIQKTTLDNGLAVISVPFDSPGIIAYYTVVRTGSRNEVEKGLSGLAHFFEHMMFRGTEKYPQERYNDVLKSLGADSNAFTSDDWTCYHMTIPASALGTAVAIESDRFENLKYDEPSFQKEARAVLGEYNKNASSPFLKLEEAMQDTAFTRHTYKHTTLGFLEDIKDMPNQYAYSKVFFDRWYRPENCTIVVTGDVKHDELVALVKAHYGSWARGKASVEIPTEPPQTEPRSAHVSWPVPTLPTLYLGYHMPASDPANPDIAALGAIEQAVFGETSPLYRELVLKEQKVVTLMAEASSHRDPGLFSIIARVRTSADLPAVRQRIAQALAEAGRTPIDSARLDAVRSHLKYGFAASLRSADAVAHAVGESIAITGRPDAMNDLFAAFERLTPADLQRVAARYFIPANETVVILETEKKK